MIKKLVALVALLAIMLGPETLCNVMHIGELPSNENQEISLVENWTVQEPATVTYDPSEDENQSDDEKEKTISNHSPLTDDEWNTLIGVCADNNVPLDIALGLIWVESRFNPDAVSKANCYGYCQLNPKYFPCDLTPIENIREGIGYLGDCVERYGGDMAAALTAYHSGYDTGERWYSDLVMKAANDLKMAKK